MVRELELKRMKAKFPENVPQNCVRSALRSLLVSLSQAASYLDADDTTQEILKPEACLEGTNFQTGFQKTAFPKQSLQLVTDRGLTLPNLLGRYELSSKYSPCLWSNLTNMDFKFSKSNAKSQAKSAITVNPGISSGVNHPTVKGEDILGDDIENLKGIADNPTPNPQNRPNILALGLLAIVLSAMGIVATSSCGGSLSFKIPFELQLNKNNCSVQIDQAQK